MYRDQGAAFVRLYRLVRLCSILIGVGLGCSAQPPPATAEAPAPAPRPVVVAAPVVEAAPAEPAEPSPPAIRIPDDPFPGAATVSVDELVDELEAIAVQMESVAAVRGDYDRFLADHGLDDSEELFRDYVRVKLVFEATRDGGWWQLRWKVTNRKPNSENIWAQWAEGDVPEADEATAVGECDELSALFAFVVRKLGVRKVGLFWPVWNHVVAVWTVGETRIVVPTSQIFIGADDSLGTNAFNPYKQKTIYTYTRRDVKGSRAIPAELARFFIRQAAANAGRHANRAARPP